MSPTSVIFHTPTCVAQRYTAPCLGCDGSWPLEQVIDAQYYDDPNRATFGYASIGTLSDAGPEEDLGNLEQQPPVTANDDC